jgi:cell division protein FtsA
VLTGGTSQLVGISEWWSSQSGGNIRIGRPIHLSGMPESMSAPPFAAVVGTALAVVLPIANLGASRARAAAAQGYLGRLHRWIRENF